MDITTLLIIILVILLLGGAAGTAEDAGINDILPINPRLRVD
jgi:hypothetical protein